MVSNYGQAMNRNHLTNWRECTLTPMIIADHLSLYPPPCGEGRRKASGWGSGGLSELFSSSDDEPVLRDHQTPTPNPSPQGGGEIGNDLLVLVHADGSYIHG